MIRPLIVMTPLLKIPVGSLDACRFSAFCIRTDRIVGSAALPDRNGGLRARRRKDSIRGSAMAASDMEVGLGIVWRRYSPGKLLAMPRRRLSVPTRANGGAFGKLGKWRCERVKPPSGRARTTTVREEQGQPRHRESRVQLQEVLRRHHGAAAIASAGGQSFRSGAVRCRDFRSGHDARNSAASML